jgi:hypothetical protein
VFLSASTYLWNMVISHLKETIAWLCSEQICNMRWFADADAVIALKTHYTEFKPALRDIARNESENAITKLKLNHELKCMKNMTPPFSLSHEINCFRD